MRMMVWTALVAAMLAQAHPIERTLIGAWTGTLQYRDYRSDRLVTLPTTLEITTAGSDALRFAYTYDDGPGKIVRSEDHVTLNTANATWRIQSGTDYDATFAIEGLASLRAEAPAFTLIGKGEENGAAVDLRVSYAITPTSLTIRRESRLPGQDWTFRNEYRLAR